MFRLLLSVWLWRLLGDSGPRGPVTRAARARRVRPQIDTLEDRLTPVTFFVTTASDNAGGVNPAVNAGTGTLRQAIVDADAGTGGTIKFAISGTGVQTISPLTALPSITKPVLIDGTTEPGFAGKPIIEIEGSSAGSADGLELDTGSNGSVIRDLIINRFSGEAIYIHKSNNNQILGNYLGTDYTGSVALGNGDGVDIIGSGNQVGGDTAAARNVISGNSTNGIGIGAGAPPTSSANVVEGNYIGTDAGGTQPLGNGRGIFVSDTGASQTLIGGTAPGAGNLIAFNKGSGVAAASGTATSIEGNSIFANGGLGISISNSSSPTPNTANGAQNFPVLQSALPDGNGTTVQGTLNSTASTTFRLEFFSNPAPDPSGFGQGQTFLGFTTVTTDASGNAGFTTTFSPAATIGQSISATSTGPAGTSEFAQDVQVTARPAVPSVTTTPSTLPQPSFFFLPPQQLRKRKSHHGAAVQQQLILTNNFAVPLQGRFLLSLAGLTSLQLLSAAIPLPFQATIISGNQVLIDFGPDGLPPGVGINLLLTLGKPGNNLFFPCLTFVG